MEKFGHVCPKKLSGHSQNSWKSSLWYPGIPKYRAHSPGLNFQDVWPSNVCISSQIGGITKYFSCCTVEGGDLKFLDLAVASPEWMFS